MKVIMFGPNGGHNIDPFIQLFRTSIPYKCTYVTRGEPSWSPTTKLKILNYKDSFTNEIKSLLKSEPGFIWVHAGYDIKQILNIFRYKHKDSKVSLNIWGEAVPKMAKNWGLKSLLYKIIFSKIDQIHCNWYGTYKILNNYKKVCVEPWGLSKSFFSMGDEQVSGFTKDFVSSLPSEPVKFFYPKSILPVSGQLELIEAAASLVKQRSNFLIYLWVGNSNDESMMSECYHNIESGGLANHIKIVRHPFLPFHDIKYIWRHMDYGLQLAKSDQLSTTFLEPQLLEIPIIASNIFAYTNYESKFKVDLDLIPVNVEAIHTRLSVVLAGEYSVSPENLIKRRDIVVKNFMFEKNIKQYLEKMKKKFFT